VFGSEHKNGARDAGWAGFDVVVIVASQGGMDACRALAARLPAGFPAAVLYVQHRAPSPRSPAAALLRLRTEMEVRDAIDGERIQAGVFYVAPADAQLTIDEACTLRFAAGLDGESRCLGDPLLRSVADVYGARAIGVVLSGRLSDGAAGARDLRAAGGRVLVQDPATATCPSMPQATMATGCFDLVLEPARIGDALVALVTVPGAAQLFEVRAHPWNAAADVASRA
jgi:two-component system, chemotaxis family, protein-glutamate methylesterase/glutaminase